MGSSTYEEPSERSPKKATRRAPGRTARGDGSPAPVAAAAPRVADPPVARPSPERHRAALSRVEAPPYAAEKAALLVALQQSYGNRYVQRLLSDAPPDAPAAGASGPRAAGSASGRPLEPRVRGDMEDRFGASFPAIRVHTDEGAGDAARTLGARAFTTGQDIYFSRGAYRPETPEGKHLLAHELTHTLQQRHAPAGAQSALE